MENEKKNLQTAQMESNEKDIVVKNINDELSEREKQLSKLQGEKEAMKSEIRQLKSRVESLTLKSEDEVMRLEMEHYKSKIMCIICSGDREREVGLKTCPHLFCRKCIDDTQNSRNRKCPSCGIKFTKTDIHEIKWNWFMLNKVIMAILFFLVWSCAVGSSLLLDLCIHVLGRGEEVDDGGNVIFFYYKVWIIKSVLIWMCESVELTPSLFSSVNFTLGASSPLILLS